MLFQFCLQNFDFLINVVLGVTPQHRLITMNIKTKSIIKSYNGDFCDTLFSSISSFSKSSLKSEVV